MPCWHTGRLASRSLALRRQAGVAGTQTSIERIYWPPEMVHRRKDMTTALVDDSGSDIELLHRDLSRYCQEHHIHMNIEIFSDGTSLFKSMRYTAYDLVFLDIYMKHTTGIQIAEKIRKIDPKCQIIFITVSEEHAVSAYRVHALDYLVKPYSYADLTDALERFEQVADRFTRYIELKEGRYYTRVLLSDILYTDYSNHYIQVHTADCIIRSYMSFDAFYPMLSPYTNFLWCCRNCMVNMDHIESFGQKEFLLKNGERIQIAAARRQEIVQKYADYIFDHYSKGVVLP